MELITLALTYRDTDPDLLEATLSPETGRSFAAWAGDHPEVAESVVISTCLRFELYAVTAAPQRIAEQARAELARLLDRPALPENTGCVLYGCDAVEHLLRVSAGFEAPVPADAGVATQVRRAYGSAVDRGSCGPWLHRLFHLALRFARETRALEAGTEAGPETGPDAGTDAVPDARLDAPPGPPQETAQRSHNPYAERALQAALHLRDPRTLTLAVLGAGRLGRDVVEAAERAGITTIRWISESPPRRRDPRPGTTTTLHGITELARVMENVDVCVAASSRGRLLDRRVLATRLNRRRALTLVDLAMPRNIDPRLRRHAEVKLLDLYDLCAPSSGALRFEPSAAATPPDRAQWAEQSHHAARGYMEWLDARLAGRTSGAADTTRGGESGGGQVFLVGAGPGSADLLTVRALRLLESADIIFHDALVSEAVLECIPRGVRRVPVGRRKGRVVCSQEDVLQGLVRWARRGARVVRLKGGDPAIFARTGEEAIALRRAGIDVKIVPGLTAASAAAASLGIPLTHRGTARSFAVITGHTEDDVTPQSHFESLARLARETDSIAVYMGASQLPSLARVLRSAGRADTDPVVVVERAQQADERVHWLTVAQAAEEHRRPAIGTPALVLVGSVLELAPSRPSASHQPWAARASEKEISS